jgi:tetratricopeptide (TPR) repeat protein
LGLLLQTLLRLAHGLAPILFRVRSPRKVRLLSEASYVLNRLFEPLLFDRKLADAAYCGLRNLNLAQRLPPAASFARGYASMSVVASMVPVLTRTARRWADRGVSLGRQLNDQEALAYALSRSCCYYISIGDWEEVQTRIAESRRISLRIGDHRAYEEALAIDGLSKFFAGDLEASLEVAREQQRSAEARGDRQIQIWGDNITLQALVRLGRCDEAQQLLPRLRRLLKTPDATAFDRAYSFGNIALLSLALGDLVDARKNAERTLESFGQDKPAAYFLRNGLWGATEVFLFLARAMGEGAKPELHERLLQSYRLIKQFSQFQPFGRPAALFFEAGILALHGRESRARAKLTKALRSARHFRMPYDEGRIRLELAKLSEPATRRRHLDRARELFAAVGAVGELEIVDQQRPLASESDGRGT